MQTDQFKINSFHSTNTLESAELSYLLVISNIITNQKIL